MARRGAAVPHLLGGEGLPLPHEFAHLAFFAHLPAELRALCCSEKYGCASFDSSSERVVYRQGSAVEDSAGLYVILEGEVSLHVHDPAAHRPDSVGTAFARLGAGDAFGDEVLRRFDGSSDTSTGSIQKRCTSAVVPAAALCISLTNEKVLGSLAAFIGRQQSAFYYIHPLLCLQALRAKPEERGRNEELRITQCIDALGVFGNKHTLETANLDFLEVLPGQAVFQEADRINACYVVVYGQVVLCQHGAGPDSSQPANPRPMLGNAVGEICAGEVLIDPAPWFHGIWPCSAIASTKVGVIGISRAALEEQKSQGVFFNPHQIVSLLNKKASTRTRLDNSRIAQMLSAFKSMHGVPLDRRIDLAQLMTGVEYQTGDQFAMCAEQELLVVSGAARESLGHSRPEDCTSLASRTPTASLYGEVDMPDQISASHEVEHAASLQMTWRSMELAVNVSIGKSLQAFLEELKNDVADDVCTDLLSKAACFLSAFELGRLSFWLDCGRRSDVVAESCMNAEIDVQPGDVIGWHVFPCKAREEGGRFNVLSPTSVAVLAHSDIEGLHGVKIFRRASAYISPQAQVSLVKALRSPPPRINPDDIAITIASLSNIPPLSMLREAKPDVFRDVVGCIQLIQLGPAAFACQRDTPVDAIYIVIDGTLASVVLTFEDESSWAQREECIAVYGCGDSVGFADLLDKRWTHSLQAGHIGCTIAAVPSELLASHAELLVSCIDATVSPGMCSRVLSVPRMLTPKQDLMVLRMLMANSPSFKGLSSECVGRLCARAFHRHVTTDQLVCVQDDDAELFVLVLEGLLGSYSGLPPAIKAVLSLQAGTYASPNPLQQVAEASMSDKFHSLTDEGADEEDKQRDSLWLEEVFVLDEEGCLSSSSEEGRRTFIGNVRHDLTDLEAPAWLLKQCSHALRGSTEASTARTQAASAASLHRVDSSSGGRRVRRQVSQNRPSSGQMAPELRTPRDGQVKVGHATNRVVLRFGDFSKTLWSASTESLCQLICISVKHYLAVRHTLGNSNGTISAEGRFGDGILRACRHYTRVPRAPGPTEQEQSRPSTADQRPGTAQKGEPEVTEQQSVPEKNASSMVVLHPSELLMLRKSDVEDAMLELRAEKLLAVMKSLQEKGVALARDTKPQDMKAVAACLEPCKFEPTELLFSAGLPADEVFLLTKGTCSLFQHQAPSSRAPRSSPEKPGLQGRPMPHVRGQKRSENPVAVSVMQAPCMLGLQKTILDGNGRAIYSMSSRAVGSVEAYVFSLATMEANHPELKGRFIDRLAGCLAEEAALLNEGLGKIRVLPGSTDALMASRRDAMPKVEAKGDVACMPGRPEEKVIGVGEMGLALWDNGYSQKSIQAAAAYVGSEDLRRCFEEGVMKKSYRTTAQCSNCFRLMYPEEDAVCGKCGCVSAAWHSKLAAMSKHANYTMEHLQVLRQQRREHDLCDIPKGDIVSEQPEANYATVLSHGKDGVVLSLGLRLPSEEDGSHLEREHEHEDFFKIQDGDAHDQYKGQSTVATHPPDLYAPASPRQEWCGLEINALRPNTSSGADLDDLQRSRAGLRSRDSNVRRSVAKTRRPASSTPGLGNGLDSSALMAREVGAVAQKERLRGVVGGARLRARSALPKRETPPNLLERLYQEEERPRTSPTAQTRVRIARPASSAGIATLPRPLSPFVGEGQLKILGLPGRSSPPPLGSPVNSSMKMYKVEVESQLKSNSLVRRYHHALSAPISSPAWFLNEGLPITAPAPVRGPAAFLVSKATRSQVALRRSAPKYYRLSKLHVGSIGSEF